jgi:ubiquitin-protein ligase
MAAAAATPTPARLMKILWAHYKRAATDDHENLLYLPDEADARVCHVLVVGLGYPYFGGETIFKLTAPNDFPLKPPEVRNLTENGVYTVGCKICVSIGEFHDTDRRPDADGAYGWKPTLGIRGFVSVGMLSGLLAPESLNHHIHPDSRKGGIGIENAPPEERQRLASVSKDFNLVYNTAIRDRLLAHASAHPELRAAKAWMRQNAQSELEPDATTTPKDFEAAFGEPLLKWCDEVLPRVGLAGLHLTVACRLQGLIDLNLQKAVLLAHDTSKVEAWELLTGLVPSVAPLKEDLATHTVLARRTFLLKLITHISTGALEERDALIATLRDEPQAL